MDNPNNNSNAEEKGEIPSQKKRRSLLHPSKKASPTSASRARFPTPSKKCSRSLRPCCRTNRVMISTRFTLISCTP